MTDFITLSTVLEVVTLTTAVYSIIFLFYRNSKLQREELKKSQVELSLIREKLESQIYAINSKINSTELRWKDVNHLLLNSINAQIESNISNSVINNSFFNNLGIKADKLTIKKDQIFFLTPFHNEFEEMFIKIKSACQELGFKVIRGDEEFIKGNILKYILINILESRIVVANLTGRNSNVYYELGIAHSIGKPVILLTEDLEEVPFDIRNNRLIIYNKNSNILTSELKKSLSSFLINN